ncbi:GNAT family N-acetyltransferase [Microbacterium sp. 1P10UB]|uniref:GNAT family N-acetyltransferase n=1 Tax=unclassified Microbacterium TaxID=2609290 RepID=UPI0039A19638
MPGVIGLVLAAGAGTRFGGPKALAREENGTSWIERAVRMLRDAGCETVLVTLGAGADEAASMVPDGATAVLVDDWRDGLGASLRAGLGAASALPGDALVVTPVDTPAAPAVAATRVVGAVTGPLSAALVRAGYRGQPGHPVLIGRDHWAALAATAEGDRGAGPYLRAHGAVEVECGDLWSGADVDRRPEPGNDQRPGPQGNRLDRYRPGDDDDLVEICVRTADAGADATGLLTDDRLWAEIFVLPYLVRHPEFAFVVRSETGRVTGYTVGRPDTVGFEAWFRDEWWPERADRWEAGPPRQDGLLRYAAGRGRAAEPYAAEYPAHLHIDLLPELQGQGWGRRLIDTLVDELRRAGVPGVHLVASADNSGAAAFYPRVGFTQLPSGADVRAFGRIL